MTEKELDVKLEQARAILTDMFGNEAGFVLICQLSDDHTGGLVSNLVHGNIVPILRDAADCFDAKGRANG